ncbi:MAG: RnfH family protein [Gammaproteobacteria bacterium]
MTARITVEVVSVRDGTVARATLAVPPGTTLRGVAERARLAGVDLAACRLGVFGVEYPPDHLVRDGDRVEIYHPLRDDPKAIRRRRAAAQREAARRR